MTASEVEYVNEVRLSGRVSGEPRQRTLPSGDRLVAVRIVVARSNNRRRDRRGASVDTVDCVAWLSRPRAALGALKNEDFVLVRGALRRRFWRGEHGPESKVEVEVVHAKRVRKARLQTAAAQSDAR